jgi:hydroxymethylpyrimidine/phosphomethylpyrimidine kinase
MNSPRSSPAQAPKKKHVPSIPRGRVLIIAGSDSGGGAGIQGDIKTVSALGGYAMTAITALTAQNTLRVVDVLPIPGDFVAQQMQLVLDDIGADAIKTGMLHSAAIIDAIARVLEQSAPAIPLVVDPVMLATSGAALLAPDALAALKARLIPRAAILTPNLPEAALLLGHPVTDIHAAATELLALGPRAVLLKGGHGEGDMLTDILVSRDVAPITITTPRIATRHTHGTGCAMASALATGLAQELTLEANFRRAHAYVQAAIKAAPGFGVGNGPLGH